MGLHWSTVKAEHVEKACALVKAQSDSRTPRGKGIVIYFQDQALPAKEVARIAYLIANGRGLDTPLKFSSGDGTINLLVKLGFRAERLAAPSKE